MTNFRKSGKKIKKRKKQELRKKYIITKKSFKVVTEELKQIIFAKQQKLRCYGAQGKQYRQNKPF